MTARGKTVVITGASMGIGEQIAAVFLRESANVVLSSRDLGRLEAARAGLGSPDLTLAVACDVRKRNSIDQLVQAALTRFGRIDIWVNNAGYGLMDSVIGMDIAQCRALFDTNLFGAVECMQAVIPLMKRQGGGTIINISSAAGHIAVPYMAAYCASKFALNAIGKAARVELKRDGIHVMTVCPGYVATEFATNAVKGDDRQRISAAVRAGISPERVARAVFRGYLRQSREVVVPWHDRLIIKLYQLAPTLAEWSMARMLRPADEVMARARSAKKV
jgi:short-subunit dehydrogenase